MPKEEIKQFSKIAELLFCLCDFGCHGIETYQVDRWWCEKKNDTIHRLCRLSAPNGAKFYVLYKLCCFVYVIFGATE